MENLLEKIKQLWPEFDNTTYSVESEGDKKPVIIVTEGVITLFLFLRIENENKTFIYRNLYDSLETIVFPQKFQINTILTKDLRLREYGQLNNVFKFKNNKIKSITITDEVDRYEIVTAQQTIKINPESIIEIIGKFDDIYKNSKEYSSKYVTYKTNEYQKNYFGIEKDKKTTTVKGEFKFIVDRFNLPTKNSKADFNKYLDNGDTFALQELCLKLIQKEVFEADFLTMLNDYFIKVKLEEVIKLGREISSLKSASLKTNIATQVISKIETDKRKIKQLENVWQKYFEKYLSFLIFSYQSIYPKIELKVEAEKKYPDFIGINHFGGVDIIEIKTHLKNVLTKDSSHGNYAFSSEMSKAIIQTINYMDALTQEKFSSKVKNTVNDIKSKILEGNLYRPRGIIVISTYDNLVKGVKQTQPEFKKVERDFTKLRHGLHNIQVLTFDELLNMAERYKDNIVQ